MTKHDRLQRTKPSQPKVSRRRLLLLGGAGAVALAGGGLAYFLNRDNENGFSFLNEPRRPENWDIDESQARELTVPLWKSKINSGMEKKRFIDMIMPHLQGELDKLGISNDFDINFSSQNLGFPSASRVAEDACNYSRRLYVFWSLELKV